MVSLRLRCAVELPEMFPTKLQPTDGRIERARIMDHQGVSSYHRQLLLAGDSGLGPAVIAELDVSIRIPPGWRWRISTMGHLVCHDER
jgi:hypothetical protein